MSISFNEDSLKRIYRILANRGYERSGINPLLNAEIPEDFDALANSAALNSSEPSGPSSFLEQAVNIFPSFKESRIRAIENGYDPREVNNTFDAMLGYGGLQSNELGFSGATPNTTYSRNALTNFIDYENLLEPGYIPNKYMTPSGEPLSASFILGDKLGAVDANTGEIFDESLLDLLADISKKKYGGK